jgi:hypothetical protein
MSIRIDGTNTTANPGITGGDVDTGLQFGTDEVSIVTGGTDRVTVDSSGNVDIGSGNIALNANGSLIGSNVVGTEVPTNDIGLFVNNSVASVTNFIVNGDGTTKIGLGAGNQYGIVLKPREASNKPYLLVQDTETANSPNVAISAAGSAAYYDGTAYKWQLNADGSATFAGGNIECRSTGQIALKTGAGTQTNIAGETGNTAQGWNLGYISSISSGCQIKAGTSGGCEVRSGATAWVPTTSESRLKDILSDPDKNECWNLVRDIELKRYFYKDQDDESKEGVPYMGPMADWLEKQDPELVIYQEPDENGPVRTYNQGLLDMKALQALSTALTRIEALEAEVTALKGGAS